MSWQLMASRRKNYALVFNSVTVSCIAVIVIGVILPLCALVDSDILYLFHGITQHIQFYLKALVCLCLKINLLV
jgi:hypothetical protein